MSYAYDANNRQTSATGSAISQTAVYDCAGQRVQTTANGVTRTMVYDIFGQDIADYSGSAIERENIYRGGQLLATQEYAQVTTQNVTWTDAVGVSISGNSLTDTAANGWGNSGAASTQSIASGEGYMEFTASETWSNRNIGLSHGDTGHGYWDINFGFYLQGYGYLNIYEYGANVGNFGSYVPGDVLRVAVEGGVVKYRKNGVLLYTSTSAPTYPLLANTALLQTGSTLNNVVISGNLGGGLKYVLQDIQGSTRAVMNNNGPSSTIIARHDYLPFGEEIGSGTDLRTPGQFYGAPDSNRQTVGSAMTTRSTKCPGG